MKLKKLIFSFLFIFLTTENVFSKALPPGTGIGDVPANVLILLDKSGSMGWAYERRNCKYEISL